VGLFLFLEKLCQKSTRVSPQVSQLTNLMERLEDFSDYGFFQKKLPDIEKSPISRALMLVAGRRVELLTNDL